ncbi:MAG: pilus assembly protein CpaE [Actinomycetota bacterium]|nr:pilus assembly protein CpaE [Actinomycetota bacterium]
MITTDLAQRLHTAGVRWDPAPGDRFVVTDPQMAGEVFVISNMTVDVHRFPQGTVIGFNGTTEWALDSVEQDRTLWLPREEQLRALLAATFRRLERASDGAWTVTIEVGGDVDRFLDPDVERAYAHALLYLVTGER